MKGIKLGYEVETCKEVGIKPSHLIVTGITQLSGKTTTLEALIKRSKLKAIVFKTKIGEKSFTEGQIIPPFFKDRSDYEFIKSLIEAYAKEKLFLEKGTLMRLCQGAVSLLEIKKRVDDTIVNEKLRGIRQEIYTRLQHYLENIIPQIQYANLSKVLTIYEGINIMDLERFTEEVQSLIIQSVITEVLTSHRDIIVVIPEAWKFLPQKYNNPCKRAVESFIRQGATNNNYVWIDSQDMAGVDKQPLKQVSTWVLGYQSERNEVKHTLDQISLPQKMKPKEDEIMTLKLGHFFLSSYDGVTKAYVQPSWLDDEKAVRIAGGELDVTEVSKPESLTPYSRPVMENMSDIQEVQVGDMKRIEQEILFKVKNELVGIRHDFFNKIADIQSYLNSLGSDILLLKSRKQETGTDEIVSMVLQKMPQTNNIQLNRDEIIAEVLKRVPAGSVQVYEVAPLEKIAKGFLEEAKQKILSDVNQLDEEQKKMLKFVETQNKGCSQTHIIAKCLYLSATSGGTRTRISEKTTTMANLELVRKDKNAVAYPHLKNRIRALLEPFNASNEDIEQVYNHILMEML